MSGSDLWTVVSNLIARPDSDFEERRRRILLFLICLLGVPTLLGFAVSHLVRGNAGVGFANLVCGLVVLGMLAGMRKIRRGTPVFRATVYLWGFLLVYYMYTQAFSGYYLFWVPLFPLLAFFLLGKNEGLTASCVVVAFTAWALFYRGDVFEAFPEPSMLKLRFLMSLAVIVGLSYFYDYVRAGLHEVTERRRKGLEQEKENLALAKAELQDSLVSLRMAQEHMVEHEKMAALGGLVAGVAHEINTPLGIGVTAASYMRDKVEEFTRRYRNEEVSPEEVVKFGHKITETSETILSNLTRAAHLVGSFKVMAVDQASEDKRRFRVREYLEDVLLSLRPRLKRTPHKVRLECPGDLSVESYPGAFSQIVTNLVMNSVTHGFTEHQNGNIGIEVSLAGGILRMAYQDDGRGMSEATQKKVFEPFYTTGRDDGCTGLGMFVVYNLVVTRLQGAIRCESAPGDGVLFVVEVPVEDVGGKTVR
ncbi:MAG: sensor histidine kinase [Desulfatibacillaceae bacterium]